MLGLWYSVEELLHYDEPKNIRSCDSVLLSFLAKHGMGLNEVRPDGYTLNLETDVVPLEDFLKLRSLMCTAYPQLYILDETC